MFDIQLLQTPDIKLQLVSEEIYITLCYYPGLKKILSCWFVGFTSHGSSVLTLMVWQQNLNEYFIIAILSPQKAC